MSTKIGKSEFATIALFGFFLLFFSWWVFLNLFIPKGNSLFDYFADSYGVIAGVGGIACFSVAKSWGGPKSALGRALIAFSVGLFFQFLGQVSYGIYHYIFLVDNPYPSFGEIFYFGSIPIYIYAVWLLGRISGTGVLSKTKKGKLWSFGFPTLMMLGSYFLLLRGYEFDWSQPIAIFLDFGYPLGRAVYVSLAISAYFLVRGVLGGVMRNKVILVLLALVIQYTADTIFLYRTFTDTWYAGGFSDIVFVLAYFMMAISILSFNAKDVLKKLKLKDAPK